MAGAALQPTVRLKSRDAWWTVAVVDPLVVPLVRRLLPLRAVTPNRLTVLALLLSVVSAAAFASGRLAVGAVVVQIAFLADCMDGKLAAARREGNPLGAVFDTIGDSLRDLMNITGLVIATLGGPAIAAVALIAYAGVESALLRVATEQVFDRDPSYVVAPAKAGAVLRLARGRAMPPASVVERGLLVFSVAPLLGRDAIAVGALLAFAVASAEYLRYARRAVREAGRLRSRGATE